MGKNKKAKSRGRSSSSQHMIADSAVCNAVDGLWRILQNSSSEQLGSLWEEYDKIQVLIYQLRDLQSCPQGAHAIKRADNLPTFEKWLQDHGAVYCDNLEIVESPGIGFGLRCRRDLKCDERVIQIPENTMMSSETALHGVLGTLIRQDHMLQSMPNVSLALHLLNEKCSQSSFWKPYIDILPSSFSLPLYFSKQELSLLQGSPCLIKCLLQVRNITKLYSHLHQVIRATGEESLPLFKSGFSYDDFIWAVSCVMSRQNEIPSKASLLSPTLALIPLWDLCNHCSGHISTYFNAESSTCDCYAQQDFKADEEFRIFYGPRSNAELLLQQGFVYLQNKFDSYQIKLGLSSVEDDKTKILRLQLLKAINLPMSGSFLLSKSKENPFSSDLSAFVRIFTASLISLEQLTSEKSPLESTLKDTKWQLEDMKVLDFLEKRCSLLLKQYQTSISQDEELLKSDSISAISTQAILMRMCEKKILIDACHYAVAQQKELKFLHTQ